MTQRFKHPTDKAFFLKPSYFLKKIALPLILALIFSIQPAYSYELKSSEVKLLKKIERDTLKYFLRFYSPTTGLIQDNSRSGSPASIAATGFGLTALAIGADRGWLTHEFAQEKIIKTLTHLEFKAEHKNGFFYHFLDMKTGKRVWNSEASSIDTALLIAGALTAAQYYPGTEIEERAHRIYERVNWKWMLNDSDLICMGWTPESGFLPYYWDSYNELLILQALAIGAPKHAAPKHVWDAWFRNENEFNSRNVIFSHSGSLFTYQYPHAFIDFRELNDRGTNYFENSIQASLANREYTMQFEKEYKSYHDYSWGLSAAPGPGGYRAYGAKPGEGFHDGTIAPHGAIGSIIFTPKESLDAIKYFYLRLGNKIYKKFGFVAAFNEDKKFYSNEYLGIDQGIILLMLENFTNNGAVWKKFMQLKAIQSWIEIAELKSNVKG